MNQNDYLAHQFKTQGYVVSTGVYLYSGGKILIVHPTDSYGTVWSIPKGQVDHSTDTLRDTYIRELEEETSIDISKYTIVQEVFLGYNRYKRTKKYLFSYFIEIEEDITELDLICPSTTISHVSGETVPEVDIFKWVEPMFLLDHLNFKQYSDANKNISNYIKDQY